MTINNLKDLAAVIDTCRRKGVKCITIGTVTIELGATPTKRARKEKATDEPIVPQVSEEEMLFWSSQQ